MALMGYFLQKTPPVGLFVENNLNPKLVIQRLWDSKIRCYNYIHNDISFQGSYFEISSRFDSIPQFWTNMNPKKRHASLQDNSKPAPDLIAYFNFSFKILFFLYDGNFNKLKHVEAVGKRAGEWDEPRFRTPNRPRTTLPTVSPVSW